MDEESAKALALRLVEEDMIARRLAEGTKKAIRIALRDFFRWASKRGTPDVRRLGKKDLVSYHSWLGTQVSKRSGEPLVASTRNSRFQVVLFFYSCLYRAGAIRENPGHGLSLKTPEPRSWRRRPLTREEITKFLETIDVVSETGFRD